MSSDKSKENRPPSTEEAGMSQSVFDRALMLLFMAIVIIMFTSIVFRYVFNNSLSWADETIRFLFVWFTLLGAAVVYRDNMAIRVDFLIELMPPSCRRLLHLLELFLVTCFYIFLTVAGMIWVAKTEGTMMSSLRLPLNWCFYAALPTTSLIALYFIFLSIFRTKKDDTMTTDATQPLSGE